MIKCAGTYQHLISERADIDEIHAGVWQGWRVGHVQGWRDLCCVQILGVILKATGSQLFIKVYPCVTMHEAYLSSKPKEKTVSQILMFKFQVYILFSTLLNSQFFFQSTVYEMYKFFGGKIVLSSLLRFIVLFCFSFKKETVEI